MGALEIYNKGELRYASDRGELSDGPVDAKRKSLFQKGLLLWWRPEEDFVGSYFSVRTPAPEQFFAEYRNDGRSRGRDLLREYREQIERTGEELGWKLPQVDEESNQVVIARLLEADPTPPGEYDPTTIQHLLKRGEELDFVVPDKLTALRLFKHFIATYPEHSVAICQSGRVEEFDPPVDVVISPSRNADGIRGTDGTHRRIVAVAEEAAEENLHETVEVARPASAQAGWLTDVLRRAGIHDLGLTALPRSRHQRDLWNHFKRALVPAGIVAALAVFVYVAGVDVLLGQFRGATDDVMLSLVPRSILPWLSFRVPYWSVAIVISLGALVTLGVAYNVGTRGRTDSARSTGGTARGYDSDIVEELKNAIAEMRRNQFVDAGEILTGLNESRHDPKTMVVRQRTLTRERTLRVALGVAAGLILGGVVGYGLGRFFPLVLDNWLLTTNALWIGSLTIPSLLVVLIVREGAVIALGAVASTAASMRARRRGRRGGPSNKPRHRGRNRDGILRTVFFFVIVVVLASVFGFLVFYLFGGVIERFISSVI